MKLRPLSCSSLFIRQVVNTRRDAREVIITISVAHPGLRDRRRRVGQFDRSLPDRDGAQIIDVSAQTAIDADLVVIEATRSRWVIKSSPVAVG